MGFLIFHNSLEDLCNLFQDAQNLYPSLFEQALIEDRPVFVDYFLRRRHSPFDTTGIVTRMKSSRETMSNGSRSNSGLQISQSEKNISEKETDSLNDTRADYALKFVIEDLYKSIKKTNFDVRYIHIYNILLPYLYIVFVALEYSKDIKGTRCKLLPFNWTIC